MSHVEAPPNQAAAGVQLGQPETRLQAILLTVGYALSAMFLSSAVASPAAVFAAGMGAVAGVWLYRWHASQSLRNVVPASIGLALIAVGLVGPALLGRWGLVPTLIGIPATLIAIQGMTLAMLAVGVVLLVRSISQSARLFSILDAVVMIAAICLRFAAHRNYHWGNPRFFADWAGIEGYELPTLFALLGLAALTTGLIASMRRTTARHAATSVLTLLTLFVLLMWIGGRFLRNPTPDFIEPPGGLRSIAAYDGSGDANDAGDSGADGGGGGAGTGSSGAAGATSSGGSSSQGGGVSGGGASSASRGAVDDDPFPSASSQQITPQPTALVLLEDDFQPYEKFWYFRQTAISLFNGKRLVVAADERFDTDIPSGFSNDEVFIQEIPRPEDMHRIVPMVVNLIAEQPRPFGLPSMISFAPLPNPAPQYFRQSYRATSCALIDPVVDEEVFDLYANLFYCDAGDSEWDDAVWAHYTKAPDDPRFKALAEEIVQKQTTADLEDDLENSAMIKALSIQRWLEKNTTYSHDPKFDDPHNNPAEQFLFGARHGYCVHIAHASVYLMRSLGIPARISGGYMVPTERSGKSSSILIQSTDAHAWAEIYLEAVGWVIIDAMPEQIDESTQAPSEPDKTVSQFLADKARKKDQHKKHIQETSKPSRGFPLRMIHLPWALVAAIVLLYFAKAWILLSPRFAPDQELIRVTQRATILQLAETGMQREYGETRTEFAARVTTIYPEFAKLTEFHLRQHYGRGDQLPRQTCLEVQRRTNRRIRQANGLTRWILGRLDPRFWTLVR
ncbi:Protein-glutamine gamma-glutamyltransferase [Rosistilla carotiformis]|uniref:Protein-glutamine gamma-glutamyltransferase n=1 Tax=Rosistilla carotiformis TaxID=2528017 RepID=A0A518JYV3_9BACT|nr:transglutaminase domain-containing protein [Rosistilla carotiformis]QDV70723.1 Protein-glutamine gamma-glutamyltransferase [Rosistilla carotiformis]